MRRALLAVCLLLPACSGTPSRTAEHKPPAAPVPAAPPPPARPASEIGSPSFELSVHELLSSPAEDGAVILRVYDRGVLAVETSPAPRSQPKRWSAAWRDGRHLLRVQVLDFSVSAEGRAVLKPWPEERQPPERAIEVVQGELTAVTLTFRDGGRNHDMAVERRPR